MITNKHGLPEELIRAIENDPYTIGESDYSPSSLSNPPRANAIIKKYGPLLEIEAIFQIRALFGQAMHKIAERAARLGIDIFEKRYFMKIDVDGKEFTVSAQIDLFNPETGKLTDWKSCKASKFLKRYGGGMSDEWTAQMNIQRECMLSQPEPVEVKSLWIYAFLKDWESFKVKDDYPKIEFMTSEVPIWEREKTRQFIIEKIRANRAALESLPLCSLKEAWSGNRCNGWCDASSHCSQYQESKKTGLLVPKH